MSALLDALLAAGIPANAAARIFEAVRIQVAAELSGAQAPGSSATQESDPVAQQPATPQGAAGGDVHSANITVSDGLYLKGHAQFSGDNVFDGSVHLRGNVNWHGARSPANTLVTCMVSEVESGRVAFTQKQVAVLNDYGTAKPISMLAGVYATTLELTPQIVVTGVSFDAENCAVVSSTATVYALASTASPWVHSITANTTLSRLFMGEGVTWQVT